MPVLTPPRQVIDFLRRKLAVGRHFQFLLLPDCLNEQALLRLAGHCGGTAVAACQDGGT